MEVDGLEYHAETSQKPGVAICAARIAARAEIMALVDQLHDCEIEGLVAHGTDLAVVLGYLHSLDGVGWTMAQAILKSLSEAHGRQPVPG